MLKLILVLMLAGASLSSTWFTLTCLSRVTHLPSTAGESTIASCQGINDKLVVQLGACDTTPSKNQLGQQFVALAQIVLPMAGQSALNYYVDSQ